MKILKWGLIFSFALILLFLCVIAYKHIYIQYYYLSPQERYFYSELNGKLQKGETEIYLKDLTDFKWDKVKYLGPYCGIVEKGKMYFFGKKYIYTGNLYRDLNSESIYDWCLCFITGDRIVEIIRGKDIGRTSNSGEQARILFGKKAKLIINKNYEVYQFIIQENE